MRPHALALAFCLALSAACGDEREAVLDYTVMDATPAVPLRALQVFQVGAGSNGGIAMVWGDDVGMPDSGSVSYRGDLPPPFRLCAVGLARDDDQLFHARSEPVELVLDETSEVVLTLAPVEADSGVPAPCGAEVQPWPEGV